MPLILAAAEGSYTWPVTVLIPTDGGKHDKLQFEAKFRRMPQDRTEQLMLLAMKNANLLQMGEEPNPEGTDRAVADEVLTGWAKVLDADNEEVPYSETNKQQLLIFPGAASAIVMAWYESINGKRAKN